MKPTQLLFVLFSVLLAWSMRAETLLHTTSNRVVEWSLSSACDRPDPFTSVDLDARVSDESGHLLLQPGHSDWETLPIALEHLARARREFPDRPSLMGEVNFEGMHGGGSGPKIQRFLFWSTVLSGAPGFPLTDITKPYCAGIPGRLRIVFLPKGQPRWREPFIMRGLEPGLHYTARYIDPITGHAEQQVEVVPSATGEWPLPYPQVLQDWVLVMEKR